jgi:hypothetical protein
MIKFFQGVAENPFRYIEWILAIVLIVGGLYLGSPWFQADPQTGASAIGQTLTSQISLYLFAVAYTAPGAVMATGLVLHKDGLIEGALFWTYIIVLFTSLLSLLVSGIVPPRWLSTLSLGLIAAILWIRERYNRKWK